MTADELRDEFNKKFGLHPFPENYRVDHETYANVCQYVFSRIADKEGAKPFYEIALGPHRGIMFRNIELILKN